jgi:hypothetical protein
VQFNDSGSFGGDSGLVYNKSTNALTIGAGTLNMTGSSSGTVTIQPAAAAGTYSLTLPTSDGDAGQYLKSDGSGVLSWDTPASVGGSDTQVQFNDGGVLAGDSGLTFNKTAKALTLGGATITTSSPVIDAAQTWNDGATTFTGLKFNATDTASAAASLLMDLQVGGTSLFNVTKGGVVNCGSVSGTGTIRLTNAGSSFSYIGNIGLNYNSPNRIEFNSAGAVGWSTTASNALPNAPDLLLTRKAAANLRFGAADAAAPVAQTLSVQSVVAGTTNTAGANLTITGSQGTGTGAGGSIIFQVAPAGSSGTAQNALATALTIGPSREVTTSSYVDFGNSGSSLAWLWGSGVTGARLNTAGLKLNQNLPLGWTGSNDSNAALDTILARDAANTLALRNGANAQAFRLYNTYTDATTFERANIFWDSNVLKIGTEKGSVGGTARALELQTDGTTRLTIAATTGNVTTTGSVTTEAPTGGTAAAWRLGTVASVSPTSPNRTIEVDIGGTIYYIAAKTTND